MPIECKFEFRRLDRKSFQKLDFEVMRLSFESHNTLRRNCGESGYRNDLAARLGEPGGLRIRTETLVRVRHSGFIKEYRIDLAVDDASVYELKAAKALSAEHEGQTLNYTSLRHVFGFWISPGEADDMDKDKPREHPRSNVVWASDPRSLSAATGAGAFSGGGTL